MKSRMIILVMLLVLSEVVGLAIGEWYFRLYLRAIPPVGLSDFNTQSARIAHLIYGAGVGLVLFGWTFVGMAASGMMRAISKPAAKA